MSDVINLGTRVSNLDVSPQFDTYSKVIIHIDDNTQVSAGDNSGRVLEIDNPLGTPAIAQEMLAKLRGYRYQPYQADGALLDPASEIGDAVNTPSAYGGIYTRNRTFGRLMRADISAPHDEEINHEYQFESPQERKYKREMGDVRASLIIQSNMIQAEVAERRAQGEELSSRLTQTSDAIMAEVNRATEAEGNLSASLSIQASEIAAKVSASGGSNTSGSFSWVLNNSGHRWYANGNSTPIMEVTASGLTVRGRGEFNTGKIGGFDIGANALSYNGLTWGDTTKNYGAYIGQSGIQLGKKFSVDNSGNVKASNLTLQGNITFLNADGSVAGTLTAAKLQVGASQAYNNYGSWNGTTSTVSSNGGYWSGGAAAGYSADNTWGAAQDAYRGVNYMRIRTIVTDNTMTYIGSAIRKLSMTVNGVTYYYLGWAYPN